LGELAPEPRAGNGPPAGVGHPIRPHGRMPPRKKKFFSGGGSLFSSCPVSSSRRRVGGTAPLADRRAHEFSPSIRSHQGTSFLRRTFGPELPPGNSRNDSLRPDRTGPSLFGPGPPRARAPSPRPGPSVFSRAPPGIGGVGVGNEHWCRRGWSSPPPSRMETGGCPLGCPPQALRYGPPRAWFDEVGNFSPGPRRQCGNRAPPAPRPTPRAPAGPGYGPPAPAPWDVPLLNPKHDSAPPLFPRRDPLARETVMTTRHERMTPPPPEIDPEGARQKSFSPPPPPPDLFSSPAGPPGANRIPSARRDPQSFPPRP